MDSMTRATYNADNTLTELPGMEKPLIKDYVRVVRRPFGEVDSFTDSKYYEDLKKYEAELAKCRTIPCSPECCGLWAEGQTIEEGKDYEVRKCTDPGNCLLEVACVTCKPVAFPLAVKSEDDLWRGLILENFNDTEHDYSDEYIDMKIVELKSKYLLTKR